MSYETVNKCKNDEALQKRVEAAVQGEAWHNATAHDTQFGFFARQNPLQAMLTLMYPVALDNEETYEYALNMQPPHDNPGGDPAVITDQAILSSVQTNWPPDPPEQIQTP